MKQTSDKDPRGGSRPNAGRPRMAADGPQKRHNISLNDALVEKARLIGGGNTSAGIRKALVAYDPDQAE